MDGWMDGKEKRDDEHTSIHPVGLILVERLLLGGMARYGSAYHPASCAASAQWIAGAPPSGRLSICDQCPGAVACRAMNEHKHIQELQRQLAHERAESQPGHGTTIIVAWKQSMEEGV
jgi:hypothetical protein